MIEPPVQWMTASPLWHQPAVQSDLRRPALLRFASDAFMDDLNAVLATEPTQLADFVARKESFRARLAGEAVGVAPPPPSDLKLYQPAQGHFALVAATLVCRLPGLPDHGLDTARGERASFVVRRVTTAGEELAWLPGASGQGKTWQALPAGVVQTVLPSEERLPLLPVNFAEPEQRRRRLLIGTIPTGSRESFLATPQLAPGAPAPVDPRLEAAEQRVLEVLDALNGASGLSAAQAQETSLFVLLDLADVLYTTLPTPWVSILDSGGSAPVGSASRGLYTDLTSQTIDGSTHWLDAMRAVWRQRDGINAASRADNPVLTYDVRASSLSTATLRSDVIAALGPAVAPAAVVMPVPKLDAAQDTRYVLRCVYERPRCGALRPPVVSDPTDPFTIASFFDPDAPSRPITISMPFDPSLAGLRKFSKNVSFLVSDALRVKLGCGGEVGAISFSIPIITLCAMVVLMIFLSLLNIIFWWLPLLRICVPGSVKLK